MQGKIDNLLDGEVGQSHRLRDLQVWPVNNETLDALFDYIWMDRT
jgi:hypothetical protein